jgi:PKD repeat protein
VGRRGWTLLFGTLLATLLLVPAAASALTRSQANAIALRALAPSRLHGAVILFGLTRPLRAHADVIEAGPTAAGLKHATTVHHGLDTTTISRAAGGRVGGRAWLFWEDLAPDTDFEHPSVLLLVDDRTGRVIRRAPEAWYPLIDGKPPAFLASLAAYASPQYQVYSRWATLHRRAGRASAASAAQQLGLVPRALIAPPNLSKDCMVTIGDRVDSLFRGDFLLMGLIGRELRLKKYDAATVSDLDVDIDRARRAGCKDVLIVIAGHGYPATGTEFHSTTGGTDHIVPGSDHAQVGLKNVFSKDAQGNDIVSSSTIDAVDLRRLMNDYRQLGLTFKLVVSACFSGRWRELGDVSNLRFIATSSRNDQFSWAYVVPTNVFGVHFDFPLGHQSQGVFTETGGTIEDRTHNPTHATEFMNGILWGLDFWAHSEPDRAATGDDLAKGLAVAFHHERPNDFAAQSGFTNPTDEEHPDRVATPDAPHPVASFTFSPNNPPSSPKAGKSVFFDGTASTPPGLNYQWNFGDGSTASGRLVVPHVFAKPGIYEVTLTVTDAAGRTDSETHKVFVSGAGTKVAAGNDFPCPDATHPTTSPYVNIRIPSYAQNPTAAITASVNCPNTTLTGFTYTVTPGNDLPPDDPDGYDEWGQRKNTLHVTFNVSGNSGTNVSGSVTVTASWQ